MKAGLRVVRGPDWTYEDQDGGEGHVGTVAEVGGQNGVKVPEKYVTVVWDSGEKHEYRAGHEDAFDLYVFDNAQCGVRHEAAITCVECHKRGIEGFRWTCAQCPGAVLCTTCYMNDKHDLSHAFQRQDTRRSAGVPVPKRCDSQNDKREAQGIFPGAIVRRGPDWRWENQDGGDGNTGKVMKMHDSGSGVLFLVGGTFRSEVIVQWTNGVARNYRVGHDGNLDVKCVTPSSGGPYYKSHLPILGKMNEEVAGSDESLQGLQERMQEDLTRRMLMEPILGMIGGLGAAGGIQGVPGLGGLGSLGVSLGLGAMEGLSRLLQGSEDGDSAIVQEKDTKKGASNYNTGDRVVRGPDWKWDDQDNGEGQLGTVVEPSVLEVPKGSSKCVFVVWDSGKRCMYRAGQEGCYDLRVLDSAQSGVRHPDVLCDGDCKSQSFEGLRWNCKECPDLNLCTYCYGRDQHDVTHSFWRINTPTSKRISVGKRCDSQKVQMNGIFPGATVKRGGDWKWDNKDGGDGKQGTVVEISSWSPESGRTRADVKWSENPSRIHPTRLGHKGKVDLKCVTPATGGFYYRDHLPVLGRSDNVNSKFSVGDKVKCLGKVESMKKLQKDHGGWTDAMAQYMKKVGTVDAVDDDGDIIVRYEDNRKLIYNPEALGHMWLNRPQPPPASGGATQTKEDSKGPSTKHGNAEATSDLTATSPGEAVPGEPSGGAEPTTVGTNGGTEPTEPVAGETNGDIEPVPGETNGDTEPTETVTSETNGDTEQRDKDAPASTVPAGGDTTVGTATNTKRLRLQPQCKICMTSDANVAFVPCGHLVCCPECAGSLESCPICRSEIKNWLKTFIQ
ncbi:unnamed protein product [Lymnaea stagnalis]|uniref:RING-type E3 ubiquitin transferase n=1 Tax=Lymnaea stagnalis TaxID=6523 RepID=A0AAV2I5B4_LYMST